jgi:hypothetical protein
VGGIPSSQKRAHMTNTTSLLNRSNHCEVILDLIAEGGGGMAQRVEAAMALHSITAEQFATAVDEVLSAHSDNDIEGAAMGVAAVGLTYPDHDAEEYLDACVRVMNLRCPLLKLESEFILPPGWQAKAEEMMDMIFDGAERIRAGFALAV